MFPEPGIFPPMCAEKSRRETMCSAPRILDAAMR